MRAERFSAAVDLLIRDPEALPGQLDATDTELLNTVRRFARIPNLLEQRDPDFERQVLRHLPIRVTVSLREARRRLLLTAAGILAVLLLAVILTPVGQTAVAGLRAVFNLGNTEVQIEPGRTPGLPTPAAGGGTAIRQSLTLEQAQEQVSFPIVQPSELPLGYRLREVHSSTYPELPAWVPQPIFVELVYADEQGKEMLLRVYSISLGEEATVSGLNLQAEDIQNVQDVSVNNRPGVLLRLRAPRSATGWYEVVWEQDELILALSSLHLPKEDLLRIAGSVR